MCDPNKSLGASVKGYEIHEDKACIMHRKQSPNFSGYTVLFIHESIGIVIKYSCMILCNVNTIVARIIPCMISCMTVAPGV